MARASIVGLGATGTACCAPTKAPKQHMPAQKTKSHHPCRDDGPETLRAEWSGSHHLFTPRTSARLTMGAVTRTHEMRPTRMVAMR